MSANTNYYDILGVSKNASPDELKKAYRKAAIMNHSDKGGDPEKFKELAQAYDVLSDPVKRYQYGVDALKDVIGGGGAGLDPFDIFLSFFGGNPSPPYSLDAVFLYVHILINTVAWFDVKLFCKGGGSISGLGQTMAQDVAIGLLVSLERLYNGISQDVIFFRNVICSMCKGTGETITCKDPCQQCKGEKVVEEKKVLEVHIEKGMQTGETITFPGEDLNTRGFVFIIQEEEHPKFKRIGDDLIVEHTLSLTEALCGFQFELTHLDNRQLIIKSEPGEVVKPDQYREINNEGMPMYQKPFMRGKLYIHFTVDFPDSLTPDQSKGIEALLPRRTLTTADCELTDLVVETATCPRGV